MNLGTYKKWLAFGTGVGIEIGERDLNVTIVQARPSGTRLIASQPVERYAERPATEWGAEYAALLQKNGVSHLAATVLLPRREVIVRTLALGGVADKDLAQAVMFQIDGLHPYSEEDAIYDFARVGPATVLVGITRRDIVDRWVTLFGEAGIKVAAFTFSAAVLYGAVRMYGVEPEAPGFLAIDDQNTELEVYGESEAKPVFSTVFDTPSEPMAQRARGLALSELRLPQETIVRRMDEVLPAPVAGIEGFAIAIAQAPMTYATALASACRRLFPAVNLLPPELRVNTSKAMYVPAIALASLLVLGLIGLFLYGKWEDSKYQQALQAEMKRLEPAARRPQAIEREITVTRQRALLIDNFRRRTTADLEVLNELTKLIQPPGWVMNAEVTRDQIRLNGESDQATGLLRLLDKSPAFEASEFALPLARIQSGEAFSIRGRRKGALP